MRQPHPHKPVYSSGTWLWIAQGVASTARKIIRTEEKLEQQKRRIASL